MVYVCFFAILFTFYGLPIHIIRDMIFTLRSFVRRIIDFSRYRRATRDMNRRYPDATPEELRDSDVCIICREEMHPWQDTQENNNRQPISERWRPKKLPCGHILHFACLRSWLERQQNCPTCRRPVTDAPPAAGAGRPQAGAAGGDNAANNNQPNAAGAAGDRLPRGLDNVPRPRAWFLNLGPLRIGLGAGRDVIPNLARQVRRQQEADQQQRREQRQLLQQQAQLLGQQNPPAGIDQPQRNPEGTGTDGTNATRRDTAAGSGSMAGTFAASGSSTTQPLSSVAGGSTIAPLTVSQSAQWQLAHIEYQIEQELGALRATQEQLQIVRLLQGELNRLRAARTDPQQQVAQSSTSSAGMSSSSLPRPATYTAQRFVSQPRETAIPSGDVRLPTGVSIPEGWTLLPLHPMSSGQAIATSVQPTATPTIPSIVTPIAPLQNATNSQSTDLNVRGEQPAQTPSAVTPQTDNAPTPVASTSSTCLPQQMAGPSLPLNERSLAPFAYGHQEQPLAPEVRSREGDQPIPRDDSTSSSIDDFDDFRQQEPDAPIVEHPSTTENQDSQTLEPGATAEVCSSSHFGTTDAGSSEEISGDAAQTESMSTPSREEKGKYRATVEDDNES